MSRFDTIYEEFAGARGCAEPTTSRRLNPVSKQAHLRPHTGIRIPALGQGNAQHPTVAPSHGWGGTET